MTPHVRIARRIALALALIPGRTACQGQAVRVPEAAAGLRHVAEIPLPGSAVRFDYQSVDTVAGRLYVAHMNAGSLLVFDTGSEEVVADLPGFSAVHGVIAVPELHKVFATATGDRQVAVIDAASLETAARLGPIGYADGLAYAPVSARVFVSDESRAGRELVIDAVADTVMGIVELGGAAGNTIWDPVSKRILVAVQTRAEIAAIDPATATIVERFPVAGAKRPHGLAVDPERRLLFVADEENATLFVLELPSMRLLSTHAVGARPDVLAVDPGLGRLYVACESGVVNVFEEDGGTLVELGDLHIPSAHTVAVDPSTHRVYLPIERVGARPVLEIYRPG